MEINNLVQQYKDEDPEWSIAVLLKWLIERKQVAKEIAEFALHQALLDLENGLNISTHKGPKGFDNYVLKLSRQYGDEIYIETVKAIEENIINKYSDLGKIRDEKDKLERENKELYAKLLMKPSGGKLEKIWRVLKNEL